MALSGRVAVRATSQNNLIFSWAAVQSTAENASTVSWQLLLEAKQYGRIVATPGSPWSVTVDGKTFSGTTSLAIGNNETKALASGSMTLVHAADGSRGFSFSFSQEFWITFDAQSVGVVSGSGSAALDTIARASQPSLSASSVELGKPVTIYTNPASSFTHTLEYSFGNASGVVAQGVADACQWTPALELARQIPDSVSGTAVIKCTTYAGSTAIGSKQVTVVLTVPESIVPTVSAQWTDLSGAQGKMGCPVRHISRLQVDVSAAGAYGCTPVSPAVTLNGKAYGGGYLTDSGELSLEVSVTDSRGREGRAAYTVNVSDYAVPSLSLNASRCTADGTADEAGDHAKITVTGFVTQVNGRNTASLKVSWGASAETVSAGPGDVSWQKIVAADPNTTMAISATLADQLASTTRSMTLSTGYATLDLLAGGKGIAFGKAATREGFECAMPAYFTGGVSGIDASAVGAAPDGYGLGKQTGKWAGTAQALDDLQTNGYIATDAGVVDNNYGCWGQQWSMFETYGTQTMTTVDGRVVTRTKNNGTWSPWEWVNPPMLSGAEYRTTERCKGKPVYTRLIDFGTLPASGTKYIACGVPGSRVIDLQPIIHSSGGTFSPAYNVSDTTGMPLMDWWVNSGGSLFVLVFADMSSYTAVVRLKYTKA